MATKARTPARRLTARGAATRDRIVAAAASLVYERGIAGTSLDDVMAATGTSKSQLYHYFADKDALVCEVIKAQLGRIFAAQEAGLHEVSSWEGLQRWCDHWVTATRATQGAGGCPLGSLVGELADQSEPARRVLAQCFAQWQSYLSEGLQAMRDNGELAARADPAELALTVMSALQGGLLMAQATRSAHPLELALNMALQHVARIPAAPQAGRTALISARANGGRGHLLQTGVGKGALRQFQGDLQPFGQGNSRSEPQSAIAASDSHLVPSHRAHAVTATAFPPVPNRHGECGSPSLSLYLWGRQ